MHDPLPVSRQIKLTDKHIGLAHLHTGKKVQASTKSRPLKKSIVPGYQTIFKVVWLTDLAGVMSRVIVPGLLHPEVRRL